MKNNLLKKRLVYLMNLFFVMLFITSFQLFNGCSDSSTSPEEINHDLEIAIGEQMVVEAKLAAHFVAIAEQAGLTTDEINTHLKSITDNSVLSEFWITDQNGRAYLTNTGIDFTFNSDPKAQPQAYVFWDLLTGKKNVVIQSAQKREIDDRVFKYVGVAGIDQRRIVQVGLNVEELKTNSDIETAVGNHMVVEAIIASHLVAVAEAAGFTPQEINRHLKEIGAGTVLDEFWITDSQGHAYLRNVDIDFTFDPDPNKQPQAYIFWELIAGTKRVVIQNAQKREIDDQIFKYVGVAGIDKPRIVQVGIHYTYFK